MPAGQLEASSRIPADLYQQLQQAQQQNQTLARILAERCEQAAVHVENQHQLQDVWQQLLDMQAVPSGGSIQVTPSQYVGSFSCSNSTRTDAVCVCETRAALVLTSSCKVPGRSSGMCQSCLLLAIVRCQYDTFHLFSIDLHSVSAQCPAYSVSLGCPAPDTQPSHQSPLCRATSAAGHANGS